jgi:hypothetical protein
MAKQVTFGRSHEAEGQSFLELQKDILNWGALRPLLMGAIIVGGGSVWAVLRGTLHLSFDVTTAILMPIVLIVAFFLPFPGDRNIEPRKKR